MAQLVLITGVTGHVGFSVLLNALRSGYQVRATVRSEAKRNIVLSNPQIQHEWLSRLSLVIVPNMATSHAMDEAAKGVDYIIHIASPLATGGSVDPTQYENHFIRPAVHGTLNVLEAARKANTVQRIVMTNSIVSLIPLPQLEGREKPVDTITPSNRVPFLATPYDNEFQAYAASKIAALSVAERWVEKRKPRFDVVYLHPGFVKGRSHLVTNKREMLKGTNAILLGIALGKQFDSFIGATVHNDDVASAHIKALDASIPGNTSYILSQPTRWNDMKDIARKHFPGAVASRMLPLTGSAPTIEIDVDTSVTERVFGFRHKDYESQVVEVLSHYIDIQGKAKQRRDSALLQQEPATASLNLPAAALNVIAI